jgi:transglutaminase-like putative cysteine protease
MARFRIEHRTVYRYRRAVSFGPHRLLLRPAAHHLRVLDARLSTSPAATLRWTEDALGNVIAHATFSTRARELEIESTLELDHHGVDGPAAPLAPSAELLPLAYDPQDLPDLARCIERHHPDAHGCVEAWARRFVRRGGPTPTLSVIEGIVSAIHDELRWEPREEEGTQLPAETLARRVGACRDFALLAIEACRSLGIAARFVSGYLYDPTRDLPGSSPSGGATHAWAQVYLPGPGWVEIDPTHGRIGSAHLVRVGVGRGPDSLAPITGTWVGFPGDALGMEVFVHVRRADDLAESGPRPLPTEESASPPGEERSSAR